MLSLLRGGVVTALVGTEGTLVAEMMGEVVGAEKTVVEVTAGVLAMGGLMSAKDLDLLPSMSEPLDTCL